MMSSHGRVGDFIPEVELAPRTYAVPHAELSATQQRDAAT